MSDDKPDYLYESSLDFFIQMLRVSRPFASQSTRGGLTNLGGLNFKTAPALLHSSQRSMSIL